MVTQILIVAVDNLGDQSRFAVVADDLFVGEGRDILQPGVLMLEGAEFVDIEEVVRGTGAEEEVGLTVGDTFGNHLVDHALHRGEAGAAGDEDDIFIAVTEVEVAVGAAEGDRVAYLHVVVDIGGDDTFGDTADAEVEITLLARVGGDRVGAVGAAFEAAVGRGGDLHILAGLVLEVYTVGKFEADAFDIVGQVLYSFDCTLVGGRAYELPREVDSDIAVESGLAGQAPLVLKLFG